jgi:hypothetical protein
VWYRKNCFRGLEKAFDAKGLQSARVPVARLTIPHALSSVMRACAGHLLTWRTGGAREVEMTGKITVMDPRGYPP